jgi:hypothetical protein
MVERFMPQVELIPLITGNRDGTFKNYHKTCITAHLGGGDSGRITQKNLDKITAGVGQL